MKLILISNNSMTEFLHANGMEVTQDITKVKTFGTVEKARTFYNNFTLAAINLGDKDMAKLTRVVEMRIGIMEAIQHILGGNNG